MATGVTAEHGAAWRRVRSSLPNRHPCCKHTRDAPRLLALLLPLLLRSRRRQREAVRRRARRRRQGNAAEADSETVAALSNLPESELVGKTGAPRGLNALPVAFFSCCCSGRERMERGRRWAQPSGAGLLGGCGSPALWQLPCQLAASAGYCPLGLQFLNLRGPAPVEMVWSHRQRWFSPAELHCGHFVQ
jgi:hypothetical protein